ncbi:prolyl 3,4-dihydroxylase ofd1 [Phanerochaete sordida]|uniref:uS12 prolyl 3,4-dihydroxylase n=1 Tax=Phanerochaete sordida TaxID=48140 RepID=A0A9P3FXR7_9APHY|nr:prolyl 3,4-dihydroxylase ofd1 [Phanerochaete sordida]
MTGTRPRSPSPVAAGDSPSAQKRAKKTHTPSDAAVDPTPYFAPDLLAPANIQRLHAEYAASEPYKYCRVDKLFQDELLVGVKDEIMSELSFTEKETDIYKVNQTGDLASLNYLSAEQIALLPRLLKLRDALYSPRFRAFMQAVTGCGPLSGSKQDMSVNTYTKGCHLLNHDDVIGSRRVSYILYMPLPHYQGWQPEWGGALELYPTVPGPDGVPEPECMPSKSIPPSWNQFIFFEVQPGRSFHSVEEVVVGQGEDGRQRLSISGWFHAAQPGEEGYGATEKYGEYKSSRDQLASTSTVFHPYPSPAAPPLPTDPLSEEHVSFLSEFLNPVYLQPRTLAALASRFVEESSLELHHFLCTPLAEKLGVGLAANDARDGLGPERERRIPPHAAGTRHDPAAPDAPWELRGPPHKWRYCTLAATPAGRREAVHPRHAAGTDAIVRSLQDELFPSAAFRAWLAKVSSVLPLSWAAAARRFRPGLDYTLATSEEREARLDVVLGLTPEVPVEAPDEEGGRRRKKEKALVNGWQSGEWGGWECYMAPHEEEDDPAVYRSGARKKSEPPKEHGNGKATPSSSPNGKKNGKDAAEDDDDEDDEEDDGTLLTVQPGFNRLLLVLRDEKVMRFVKYVSAAAEGSRWDVCGEYEIGMLEEEDEE